MMSHGHVGRTLEGALGQLEARTSGTTRQNSTKPRRQRDAGAELQVNGRGNLGDPRSIIAGTTLAQSIAKVPAEHEQGERVKSSGWGSAVKLERAACDRQLFATPLGIYQRKARNAFRRVSRAALRESAVANRSAGHYRRARRLPSAHCAIIPRATTALCPASRQLHPLPSVAPR